LFEAAISPALSASIAGFACRNASGFLPVLAPERFTAGRTFRKFSTLNRVPLDARWFRPPHFGQRLRRRIGRPPAIILTRRSKQHLSFPFNATDSIDDSFPKRITVMSR
jgi:hypothetical protein